MCGRLDISCDPLSRWVSDRFGIPFSVLANNDLRPTQTISTVAADTGGYRQLDLQWGIKPHWSRKLIINAQAETVATKPTFKQAFHNARCLVPCAGWYEWKDEGGPRKQRYVFADPEGNPLMMAGLYFNAQSAPQLVTLTTEPSTEAALIHHRMPLIIDLANIDQWLSGTPAEVAPLLMPAHGPDLQITPVNS